jgi:hypothetical protein
MAPQEQRAQDDANELSPNLMWQRIPPEERLEVLAGAQAKAIESAFLFLLMTLGAALGFKNPWIFWGSLVVVPFIFQTMTNKAWRIMKAQPILEYLTARSTARIFARIAHANDLEPALMFRADLEPILSDETQPDSPEEALEDPSGHPVWVTLFTDTFVIFSESPRGAQLELAHTLFENFSIGSADEEEGEEPSLNHLAIAIEASPGEISRWRLKSPHKAKLLACKRLSRSLITHHEQEKKLAEQRRLERQKKASEKLLATRPPNPELVHAAGM